MSTAAPVTRRRPWVRRRLSTTAIVYLVLAVALIAGAVLTATTGRNMFTPGNISAILTATSTLGFIAIGQTLVILGGSLDLSVPFVVSLSTLVAGTIMAGRNENLLLGVAAALGVAALVGLVNGLIVTGLHVHGFIATLGTGLIISGYLGTTYQGSAGEAAFALRLVGATGIGPVPLSTLLMLALAGLAALLLARTRTGHHLFAVGGQRDVARLSGVTVGRPVVVAHVLCSVLAGVAGLLLLARLSVGSPTIGTQGGYDLKSIAAVVLGGTLLAGGRGSIAGTIGGVAIFAVLDNVMGAMQVNPFLQDVVRGLVIVVAVAVYARRSIAHRPPRFSPSGAASTTAVNA